MKIALLLPLAAIGLTPALNAHETTRVPDSFEQLSALVGDWKRVESDGSKFRIEFELTANGTVLVERWVSRGKTHSLTLYHRDGKDVVATHYCPQGNQPRMRVSPPNGDPKITFEFWDATNLESPDDNHQHQLSFDLTDPLRIKRGEIYASGEGEEPSELILNRIP